MSAPSKAKGRRTGAKPKISKQYMSDEAFGELVESLNYALRYERGERRGFRVTVIPKPPKGRTMRDIVKIRRRLNVSRSVFARILNVSTKTVQAWEQGVRVPSEASLKLLAVAQKHPEALLDSD